MWQTRFDVDLLDEEPFEIDAQAAHLFKHPYLGPHDVWTSDPLVYPAKPPAHWLMCAEVARRTAENFPTCPFVAEGPRALHEGDVRPGADGDELGHWAAGHISQRPLHLGKTRSRRQSRPRGRVSPRKPLRPTG